MSRQTMFAVLLSSTLLLASGAAAQEPETVRSHLRTVLRLYDDLEYERALEALSNARRLSKGKEDEVQLSLYEGIILADLRRNSASDTALRNALVLQPDATLPLQVAPKVEKRFEELRKQVKQEQAQVSPPPPLLVTSEPAATQEPGLRSRAWLPATIGGALLVGGGVSYALSRGERSRLRDDDASLETVQDLDRSVSRGKTYQTVGVGLLSAGLVGLGISAGMYLLGSPSKPGEVGLELGTDGTSAFVAGRWP